MTKRSRKECFQKLCDDVDVNPWGQAYRIVMKNLNGFKQAMPESDSLLREIVTTLQPQPSLIMEITTTTSEEVELVTDREILEICKSNKDRKESGPDGIPNKALKTAIENNVGAFVDIYNTIVA